ncbi:MAG: hypothetical protein OZX49_01159 [Immundisolibacter sp.]|jgi:hypothetical protein|nr:hypothetical protein [Immundisolibacter sp.]
MKTQLTHVVNAAAMAVLIWRQRRDKEYRT